MEAGWDGRRNVKRGTGKGDRDTVILGSSDVAISGCFGALVPLQLA